VWKRAIAQTEQQLSEMNRVVSEKMSHQRRLIEQARNYVRVRDNQTQRAASSDNSSISSSTTTTAITVTQVADDDGDKQEQQDALSAELSAAVESLKAMTSESVQV